MKCAESQKKCTCDGVDEGLCGVRAGKLGFFQSLSPAETWDQRGPPKELEERSEGLISGRCLE